MPNLKITLTSKDLDSPFSHYLLDQLRSIEWIDGEICPFSNLKDTDNSSLFITLLEDLSFQEILDVCDLYRRQNKNAIYCSLWENELIIGPTHLPGTTAGADSCFLFLQHDACKRLPTAEELQAIHLPIVDNDHLQLYPDVFHTALATLVNELKLIYLDKADQKLSLIDNASLFKLCKSNAMPSRSKYIYPLFEEHNQNGGMINPPACKILLSKYLHSKSHIENNLFLDPSNDEHPTNEYRNVAIIGGGTAGYLTALALKKAYPTLPVTLIESSKIPVIGVGEATTPETRRFLFHVLGLSAPDFYEKVKPTWKLGIKFFWGQPGDYYFNYPFGKSDIRSAYLINGHINYCSLTSLLMSNDSSFVISTLDKQDLEKFLSLSNDISYALHLDNVSFIGYLKTKALEWGVKYIDDLIIDAERKPDCNEIKAVTGETGKQYTYDLYVDCSGFKSLLIEKALGSPYISFNNSLFTDTAVTGCIPNSDKVKPYTYAESMNNGWCWNIPMRGEDHRGYVFSAAHCSIDDATRELAAKNPGIVNFKTVRFKSGRHQDICIGNVFAIGNSYAFVEPLESTGIHMIIKEVEALTQNFTYLKQSPSIRTAINRNMNDHWDYLKGFLSIHYKFNKKFQTDFWKDCRSLTDISSIQWLVDLYHEVGLLSYAGENFGRIITKEIKDDIFGLLGFDTLLLGQGEVPRNFKASIRNKNIWEANVNTWKSLQVMTVPLEKDLKILTQHPELI